MDLEILQIIQDFSTLAVLALLVYALIPLFKAIAVWIKSKIAPMNNYTQIQSAIRKIKENDLSHLSQEISNMRTEFRNEINDLRDDLGKLGERVVRIEVKIFDK